VAFVLVIALISFLGDRHRRAGAQVPRAAQRRALLALTLGPMLRVMASVVRPLVWLFTAASNAVLRLFGDQTSFSEARLSPEELQELVEEAGRTGAIDPGTSEIASRAIDFRELTAADVMVPREAIVSVSRDADADEVRRVLAGGRFARLPVYEGEPENIVGHVALKDLALTSQQPAGPWHTLVRPVVFVPTGMAASTLLRRMQSDRLPLVMVTDERGSLRGLITVTDLLEELVGDILSEGDPSPMRLEADADGRVIVPGEHAHS
jgi:putative hemolysin